MTDDGPAAGTAHRPAAAEDPPQIAVSGLGPDQPPGAAPAATEDPRVGAALERLAELDGLPLAEQAAVFRDIHARLHDALADLGPEAEA